MGSHQRKVGSDSHYFWQKNPSGMSLEWVLKVLRFYLTRITFDRKKPSGMSVGRISQFCHFWGFHSWCLVWTDWEKVQVEIGIRAALWDIWQCQRKLVAKEMGGHTFCSHNEEAESGSVSWIFLIISDVFLVPLDLYSKLKNVYSRFYSCSRSSSSPVGHTSRSRF